MKLILIRPFFSLEKFYFPRFISESLGIEALAGYLRGKFQFKVIDAIAEGWNKYWMLRSDPETIYQGLKPEQIMNKVKEWRPDAVGLTWLFSAQNTPVQILAKLIKEYDPKIKVIVGGAFPSCNPEQVLKENLEIDIVVYREGEFTLEELLDKKFQDLKNIKGIAFRDDGEVKINPPRPFNTQLDKLPLPARDLIPYKNYAKQNLYAFLYQRFKKIGFGFEKNNKIAAQLSRLPLLDKIHLYFRNQRRKLIQAPIADMVSSRGCPNNCTFCAAHSVQGRNWRARSPKNVLFEIDVLVNQYGIKHINVVDDNFTLLKSRTIEICKGLAKRNYNLTLWSNVFLPSLDEEVLKWLKKAGFHSLLFSIESGNQDVLDKIIKKRINLSKVKEMVDISKKIGIQTEGAFMFGLPGETIQTMKDTNKFIKKTGFDMNKKFIYQPFPNTKLYDICIEKDYLTPDYNPKKIYVTGDKSFIKTEEFSPEDVVKMAR